MLDDKHLSDLFETPNKQNDEIDEPIDDTSSSDSDDEINNKLTQSMTIQSNKKENKMFQSMVLNPSNKINSSNKDDFKNAGNLLLFDNSNKIEHSLSVKWDITNPDINDNIALYQHHRYHDKNYIQVVNIQGIKSGLYTFTNLVDGYYDVRLLRGTKQKHDKYVKSNVCCLGPEVELNYEIIEDNKQQYLKVIVNSKFIKSKNDCIALFYNTEYSNKLMKSVMYNYLNTVTDNGNNKEMIFKIKHIHGLFDIRYFYYNSLSMLYGNVYSGSKTIKLQNFNELGVILDDRFNQIKVYWRLYTIDPNDSQWIGIYENDKLLTYEYICKHHYLNDLHTEGVVIIGHKKTYNKIKEVLSKNQPDNKYSIKFFTKSYLMSNLIMSCSLYDSYIKEQKKNRNE